MVQNCVASPERKFCKEYIDNLVFIIFIIDSISCDFKCLDIY